MFQREFACFLLLFHSLCATVGCCSTSVTTSKRSNPGSSSDADHFGDIEAAARRLFKKIEQRDFVLNPHTTKDVITRMHITATVTSRRDARLIHAMDKFLVRYGEAEFSMTQFGIVGNKNLTALYEYMHSSPSFRLQFNATAALLRQARFRTNDPQLNLPIYDMTLETTRLVVAVENSHWLLHYDTNNLEASQCPPQYINDHTKAYQNVQLSLGPVFLQQFVSATYAFDFETSDQDKPTGLNRENKQYLEFKSS